MLKMTSEDETRIYGKLKIKEGFVNDLFSASSVTEITTNDLQPIRPIGNSYNQMWDIWIDGVSETSDASPIDICYINDLFVVLCEAEGNHVVIATSTDATTWTLRKELNNVNLNYDYKTPLIVCCNNTIYLRCNIESSSCYTSQDGINWSDDEYQEGPFGCCCWDGSRFVKYKKENVMENDIEMVMENIYTSQDGTTWTLLFKNINSINEIVNKMIYGNGVYCLYYADLNGEIYDNGSIYTITDFTTYTSQDLEHWQKNESCIIDPDDFGSLCADKIVFYKNVFLVTVNLYAHYSSDCVNWNTIDKRFNGDKFTLVDNGLFSFVNYGLDNIDQYVTVDLETFVTIQISDDSGAVPDTYSVCCGGIIFSMRNKRCITDLIGFYNSNTQAIHDSINEMEYPIGSYYETVLEFNPKRILGFGEWELISYQDILLPNAIFKHSIYKWKRVE